MRLTAPYYRFYTITEIWRVSSSPLFRRQRIVESVFQRVDPMELTFGTEMPVVIDLIHATIKFELKPVGVTEM